MDSKRAAWREIAEGWRSGFVDCTCSKIIDIWGQILILLKVELTQSVHVCGGAEQIRVPGLWDGTCLKECSPVEVS